MIRQLLLSETGPEPTGVRPVMPAALSPLAQEFPSLTLLTRAPEEGTGVVRLDASEWRAPGFDPWDWDERVFGAAARAPGITLHLTGGSRQALTSTALEVLTRYQGLIDRRNTASQGPLFTTLLAHLRALHDLGEPLFREDFRHALDTWQWVLRLEPRADLALQVAALFHDVEHTRSELGARTAGPTRDYQCFKDAHAERSAALADGVLSRVGVAPDTREHVRWLIRHHERPEAEAALALLNEADALSFFSLEASGFARTFTRARTRREMIHTLERLRPPQRWRLARIRLAPQVRRLLEEVMGAAPLPAMRAEPGGLKRWA
ncbi:DUF4202 family protein [Archangium primigenium]|uniref:DUF4202 family protein n=1 Tax=[Archangium] primigenium TaxID=2792470 RepID=UPI001959D93C|nr:DUF4202 family protein [Archangium primigenium]MBM7119268.1 DUF4202 family protein [Archangium primigenium]